MFYKPFNIEVESTPVIVYPCEGVEKFLASQRKLIEYIREVYKFYKALRGDQWNIDIVWDDKNTIMLDIWRYSKLESWGSGPLVDVNIFRRSERDTLSGVSAGDGLIVLGLEEQHRRKFPDLTSYLKGQRPELPREITCARDFPQ